MQTVRGVGVKVTCTWKIHMARETASTSVVPADTRDWLATSAPLNTKKHGSRARFSRDDCVVERREPEDYPGDCVVYTRDPLPLGQVWQATILNSTRKWKGFGGLVSGCVLCFP